MYRISSLFQGSSDNSRAVSTEIAKHVSTTLIVSIAGRMNTACAHTYVGVDPLSEISRKYGRSVCMCTTPTSHLSLFHDSDKASTQQQIAGKPVEKNITAVLWLNIEWHL